jgi:hypothetical protein
MRSVVSQLTSVAELSKDQDASRGDHRISPTRNRAISVIWSPRALPHILLISGSLGASNEFVFDLTGQADIRRNFIDKGWQPGANGDDSVDVHDMPPHSTADLGFDGVEERKVVCISMKTDDLRRAESEADKSAAALLSDILEIV